MAHRDRQPRRESAEQTRLELLEAGAELLREQPVGDIFSQVKAADVARRAGGRSIGAIYHHWRDQEAYRQDLLAYICRNGFEHHVAMNPANVAGTLNEALGTYMGWDVYHHA